MKTKCLFSNHCHLIRVSHQKNCVCCLSQRIVHFQLECLGTLTIIWIILVCHLILDSQSYLSNVKLAMATAAEGCVYDPDNNNNNKFQSSMEAFGCHLKWKELENINAITLLRERGILAKDPWDFNKRPTYFTAVRNLQGYVAYKLQEEEEAMGFFQEVLDKDPNNINALGNMLFIATENGTTMAARKYKLQLQRLFEGKNYEHRARAYADRSHAIRYFEQDMRCFHYMEYIERACVIGSCCDTSHRAEWFFDLALALYRRDVQMLYLRSLWSTNGITTNGNPRHRRQCDLERLESKIRAGFIKACNCFYDVVRISETNDIKSLSWVFIGILLNHDPEKRKLSDVFANNHELHSINADECYQRGLTIGCNHAITIRRVGAEYVKMGQYTEAKPLLLESHKQVPSWFACRHTGLMYLGMYNKSSEDGTPNIQYLKEAEHWFTMALKFKQVHADYSDLGYVYYLLGDFTKAVRQYKLATKNTQDDYFDLVETHKRWAKCLGEKGEVDGQRHQESIANHLKAQLREPEASPNDFFQDDFEFYSTPDKPGFVRILLGSHIWCTDSRRKAVELGSSSLRTFANDDDVIAVRRYKYDVFVSYAERDRRWVFAFLHKLESEHNLRGCINHRDFVAGEDEVQNILNAIEKSFKCVVVLSPAYCGNNISSNQGGIMHDEYKRYELSQALRESQMRPDGYIIPIMLRPCTPDAKIRHLTFRECCDGQFAQEHWTELVDALSDNHVSLA